MNLLYSKMLSSTPPQLLLFVALFGVGLYFMCQISVGLDQELALPKVSVPTLGPQKVGAQAWWGCMDLKRETTWVSGNHRSSVPAPGHMGDDHCGVGLLCCPVLGIHILRLGSTAATSC